MQSILFIILIQVQIGLTVTVWKRGWKWYSLLPIALLFNIGIVSSIFIGELGIWIANISLIVVQVLLIAIGGQNKVTHQSKGVEYA